ncbi:3-phosphoserine/phosphohydroxythreonine transaminase [Nitrosomonas oligotropha]|uniref:3-phosphoserine/phosphohydroxythreonine transaminase n=1 Tax=Nitrosomonas oligotropha TaxID=42354 RepID=UPI001368EDE4|nr:3-phosphoserine/phosphohydroxythreonine transaminase [Nitrosomonas oligotropha]MXS83584.1 3-phosphoserine/phosphohydroxythreonine transaminase [Nitrosomonas oligotropha]
MDQIYNFSAGPAVLPKEVLQQARDEMLDWHGSGMSVMEMSHRGKEFMSIAEKTENDLRELANIPRNYKVLFLQGGASSQFAMVPMNLLRGKTTADYINTGQWSAKAIEEASRYCTVNVAASSEDAHFTYVPPLEQWRLNPDAAYVHYTSNETIGGVEFHWVPDTEAPLVADMSSDILSQPLDVTRFGLIYAGAQKNLGPAGLTLVIVREDLLGQPLPGTPTLYDYQIHAKNDSMYNTPPTYAMYITGLVFAWLKKQGGLAAMEKINTAKANLLYDYLDSTDFYHCPVAVANRSRMNVPFTLKDSALDGEFLKQAQHNGLLQLKGHRSVGGMRASIYNAMPVEGVATLVNFMKEFASRHA